MKFLEILNEDDIIELQSSINESIYSELETNPLQYYGKVKKLGEENII